MIRVDPIYKTCILILYNRLHLMAWVSYSYGEPPTLI